MILTAVFEAHPMDGAVSDHFVRVEMADGLVVMADLDSRPPTEIDVAVREWVAAGNEIQAPTLPAPVPALISDRQFAHGLWKRGIVSREEALAFVKTGDIPAPLLALLAALPDAEREDAEMIIAGATTYERLHPVTVQLVAAFGWTPEQGDDAWREFAAL